MQKIFQEHDKAGPRIGVHTKLLDQAVSDVDRLEVEYQELFGMLLAYADSSSKTVRSGSPYRIRTGDLSLERAAS